MKTEDIEQAWPAGVPTQGSVTLTISDGRQGDDQLFDVVAENFRILSQTITKSLQFLDPSFEYRLIPSDRVGATWSVGFINKAPASDALALAFTAFYNLALDERGELYSNVAIDAPPDAMEPHRRIMTLPNYPPMLDEESGEALELSALTGKQNWGMVLEFSAENEDDVTRLDYAMLRLSALVEAGCFDIPGVPSETTDLVEPFVGHIPETGTRTAGLRGFRGEGDLVRWLLGFTTFALNRPLGAARVVFFPDDR